MRALFRLISLAPGLSKHLKISKELKKIYEQAGYMRGYQLQLQWVKEATQFNLKKPLIYTHLLQRKIEKLKPVLIRSFSEISWKLEAGKVLAVLPEDALPRFSLYAADNWSIIRAIIITDQFFDDNLHTIRKSMKDFFYNAKLYGREAWDILQLEGAAPGIKEYIDQLMEELGRFQDKCAAIRLLESAWLKKMDSAGLQQLQAIKAAWCRDKAAKKQKLITTLKADVVRVHFKSCPQPPKTSADFNHNWS
jgi:hypothetical protein